MANGLCEIPQRRWSDARTAMLSIGIFAVLSLICAVLSDGFVAADGCTHYLYAKYAFSDPVNLVDVWARPLVTALFAIPSQLGARTGVRATSLLVAISCALVAWRIAREQGHRRPVLALLFTLGQPLLFVYSFGAMTELPFALLLGAAFLAFQGRRWLWAALLIGLTPTARPEGFGFILLAALWLLATRRWALLPVLLLPLAAWDVGGWLAMARAGPWWNWLVRAWPWSAEGLYGKGNILTYVGELPVIVSPLVLPATLIGTWLYLRRDDNARPIADLPEKHVHERLCRVLVAAIPLFILAAHSLLRWMGKLGSLGEPRYLLVAAPFWGVLSASGWEWTFKRLDWRNPVRWAVAAILAPILVNAIHPAVPIHLDRQWQTARRFADWYRASDWREKFPNVVASHPGVFYFLGADPTGRARGGGFTRGIIQSLPAGTLLVWDPVFSAKNANVDDAATLRSIRQAGWVEQPEIDKLLNGKNPIRRPTAVSKPDTATWHVFASPRLPAGHGILSYTAARRRIGTTERVGEAAGKRSRSALRGQKGRRVPKDRIGNGRPRRPQPVKRPYIPKPNGKLRPLGITDGHSFSSGTGNGGIADCGTDLRGGLPELFIRVPSRTLGSSGAGGDQSEPPAGPTGSI